MSSYDLINICYGAWIGLSSCVVFLALRSAVAHFSRHRFEPPFWFYIGVSLTVSGAGLVLRPWWMVWRFRQVHGQTFMWMTGHPTVIFGASLVLAGLLIHVYNMSQRRSRATFLACLIAIAFGAISFLAVSSISPLYPNR